ncbi:MAG: OmpA family protein [Chlorobi bacterium]|nr:OmpA family protein [Chlorobiota bacterium]
MKKLTVLSLLPLLVLSCSTPYTITPEVTTFEGPDSTCASENPEALITLDTTCLPGTACYTLRRIDNGMNSPADDFAPAFAILPGKEKGYVIFTSSRSLQQGGTTGQQNLWYSHVLSRNTRLPQPLTRETSPAHIGSPSLTPDGREFYFAAKKYRDTRGDADIFKAELLAQGDQLVLNNIENVRAINSDGFDSHPSISSDGARLYFTSDRPGGVGQLDIWYSERQPDGSWGTPRNLGAPVNTSCNEVTPFICGDGKTLYFSSDGFTGAGGYDIFVSERTAGSWSQPENVGRPVNTRYDELFPVTPPTKRADSIMYFASNRPGSMNLDLYSITPNPSPPSMVILRGIVRNAVTNDPIPGASLFWKERSTGTLVARVRTGADGSYYVTLTKGEEYDVGAQAEKYFFDTFHLSTPLIPGVREIRQDFTLAETLSLRINFPFNEAENPYPYILDDKGAPSQMTWREALEFVALNLSSWIDRLDYVVLTGHTDLTGPEDYNLTLSRKRANFVKRHLVNDFGIPSGKIRVVAKGESEPLPRMQGEPDSLYDARLRRVVLAKVLRKTGDEQ